MKNSAVEPSQRALTEEQQRCTDELQRLLASDAGVIAATVSTTDGFEVASVARHDPAHSGKLAAITSSLQALGGAVAMELGLSELQSITIEAIGGRMFSVEVPLPQRTWILAVVASKQALYARSLFATRDCAMRIADVAMLSDEGDTVPLPFHSPL